MLSIGIFIILLTGVCNLEYTAKAADGNTSNSILQEMNESDYINLSNSMWRLYRDDVDYSSFILDEFSKKNISKGAALQSTMSLFELNYQTTGIVSQINPPAKYADYHKYMVQSLIMFRSYLLGMAKYYETADKTFVVNAKTQFDGSIEYNEKAVEFWILNNPA
jgi:hypothetical protein